MSYQPDPAAGQPPAGAPRPVANPFSGMARGDVVRDVAAAALLLVALFYQWNFADTTASKWWVDIATVLALGGLLVPYLARFGLLGNQWNPGYNRLVRLVASAPYVLSLLALIIVDILNGGDNTFEGGIRGGAHLGTFAIVLALQPRAAERVGPKASSEDTIWFGAVLGLLGLAAVGVLASTIPTLGDLVGTGVTILGVVILIAALGFLALLLVGVLRRDAAWINTLVGLGIAVVVVNLLDLDANAFRVGLLGPLPLTGESVHLPFFGAILVIAATAAALAPGVLGLAGRAGEPDVLRRTAQPVLLVVAALYGFQVLVDIQVMLGRSNAGFDFSVPLLLDLILALAIGATAAAAALLAKGANATRLPLLAAAVVLVLGIVQAIIVTAADETFGSAGAAAWLLPIFLAAVIAVLAAGTGTLWQKATSGLQNFQVPTGPAAGQSPAPAQPTAPAQQWGQTAPATPAPVAPTPVAPEPVSPAPVEPVNPEPVNPEPVNPEPAAPAFVAPEAEPEQPTQQWTATPAAEEPPVPTPPATPEPSAPAPSADPWTQKASDPSTTAAELAELAEHQPHTRPLLAVHPQAYPGLLEWLGSLGDPEIDAALARRR